MENFQIVKPPKQARKTQFCFLMDDDLQLWIRELARDNDVPIGDVMHQALTFARNRYSRS